MALVPVSKGSDAERQAQQRLSENLPSEWIVTTNIAPRNFSFLGSKYKGEVDCVVICPHGIFVLDFKNWEGTVKPSMNGKWIQVGKKREHDNPFDQIDKEMFLVRDLLNGRNNGQFKRSSFFQSL